MAHSVGANVEILTAIPKSAKVPYARPDKEEWIRKHFSKTINVRFGPYSQDKWKHAAPGDILIDDMPSNIESWVTRGRGIGILHNYYDFPKTKKIFSELTKF
jgi:5'(3')-deoxyribonucleotidase